MAAPSNAAPGREFLRVLQRRWPIVAYVWLVVMALATVQTLTSTKLYRAQATLEIRPEASLVSPTFEDQNASAARRMWSQYFQTQANVITSATVVEKALGMLPAELRAQFQSQPDPVRAFVENIDLEPDRASFLMRITALHTDPKVAATLVNTLLSAYLDDVTDQLRRSRETVAEFLSSETLPEISRDVEGSDKALTNFQEAAGFADIEAYYSSLIDTWRKLDARLADLRMTRIRLRAELDALRAYVEHKQIDHPAFYETKVLSGLIEERDRLNIVIAKGEQTLGPKHPEIVEAKSALEAVQARIREAIDGTLSARDADIASTLREEEALLIEHKAVAARLTEVARQRNQYQRLSAELSAAKELYSVYLRRRGDTAANSGSRLASARLLEEARPPLRPDRPRVTTNLAAGSVLGVVLGLLAMIMLQEFGGKLLSPQDTEQRTTLGVLGVIPRKRDARASWRKPLVPGTEVDEIWLEAFRTLRTEVLHRMTHGGAIAVTSPLEREGKSTVALSLARSIALEGRRVLLFDADMRRPLFSTLGLKTGLGLEDVIHGAATFNEAVEKSGIDGVFWIGCRRPMQDAAEVVGTEAFAAALTAARERFDFVVVDTPPVISVAESPVIARLADASLLVVREGSTPTRAVEAARRRLDGLGVKLLGAVQNFHVPEYGGGYGYRYRYTRPEAPRVEKSKVEASNLPS
ncbi:MAG: polysaccharide biosynthesis tyrosine autokinase [Deltaproteobacteria bacterium]|nr:polysaccharide biosynthesis tyrosine autokinase [Deltaproteobacteria bacterium]